MGRLIFSFDMLCVSHLRHAPPYLSFRLAEKKDSAAPGGRKKRALDALNLWSMTGLVIAIV